MILIGLGANLDSEYGAAEDTLKHTVAILQKNGIDVQKSSNIWKSAPVPISDQPWYRNAVCQVQTHHAPKDLLKTLLDIEERVGRVRSYKNAPRILDLDIISYNKEHISEEGVNIPHLKLHERAFVLFPLKEVTPIWGHPVSGLSIDDMIEKLPAGQEIECIPNSKLIGET